jgi:uncharacterized protein YbcC (UPF0753/DUF2309 family)
VKNSKRLSIAVVGAGIYGSTIAIKLANFGHNVTLYDPLGFLQSASGINQFRIHRGYHYPRSGETINEIMECRFEFINEYSEAIIKNTKHYYAIPYEGTRTTPLEFESVMNEYSLPLVEKKPKWMDLDFIQKCYEVDEDLYSPSILRDIIKNKIKNLHIKYVDKFFRQKDVDNYDKVVYATYGLLNNDNFLFKEMKLQVVEKVLFKPPKELVKTSLVLVDGPFTAFDSYENSELSLFGSALHTCHWSSNNINDAVPDKYLELLNKRSYEKHIDTKYDSMRSDAALSVPMINNSQYIGSKFTLRLLENDTNTDRRVLKVSRKNNKEFYVFSGKVTSSVKAAKIILQRINEE